jgi:hypothetical protein
MLTILHTYYDNPKMLACHMQEWERYSALTKSKLQIIVVDDCSQKFPAKEVLEFPKGIQGRCFRLTKNVLYNTLSARNIGFYNAKTKWVLNLDIDHMISAYNLNQLLSIISTLDENRIYQFRRIEMFTGEEKGSHGAGILLTKELFWKMGGYDERLSGRYYGTSGVHHRRFRMVAGEYVQLPIPLFMFDCRVIKDAINTESTQCRMNNKEKDKAYCKKLKGGKIKTMSFPYEEVVI